MRQTLLIRLGLLLAAMLGLPLVASAQDPGPITIGVLTDMSGSSTDMSGQGSVEAVKLAVADAGGMVLGRKLAVISGDHQLRADIATGLARRWYDTEGVQLIVDVPVSSAGLAVEVVADEKRKLFITSATLTSDFTDKFCSPYAMQWNYNTVALARAAATAAVHRGLKRWFFLTADYAFGQALMRDARTVLEAQGGSVAGSALHPFNSPDLTSFVLQAIGSDAQAIALANGPPDNVTAIKQANEFGLAKSGKTMVSMFTVLTDIRALGLKLGAGLIFPDSFYWTATTPRVPGRHGSWRPWGGSRRRCRRRTTRPCHTGCGPLPPPARWTRWPWRRRCARYRWTTCSRKAASCGGTG